MIIRAITPHPKKNLEPVIALSRHMGKMVPLTSQDFKIRVEFFMGTASHNP
jgi:hypothetical protein